VEAGEFRGILVQEQGIYSPVVILYQDLKVFDSSRSCLIWLWS
jgi:hypothetical protein